MGRYVGLDASMEEAACCVRNAGGAIAAALARLGRPTRAAPETGRMANWLRRQLIPAICQRRRCRQAHAVLSQMPNKTAANAPAMLAELPGLARGLVPRQRMDLDNTIRGR
jgi:hypothetical protein